MTDSVDPRRWTKDDGRHTALATLHRRTFHDTTSAMASRRRSIPNGPDTRTNAETLQTTIRYQNVRLITGAQFDKTTVDFSAE